MAFLIGVTIFWFVFPALSSAAVKVTIYDLAVYLSFLVHRKCTTVTIGTVNT